MTDYKAFYLDYVPEEKIIRVQKQHFYPIKRRVDPYFALVCNYSIDTTYMCCCHQAAEAFLLSTKDLVGENAIVSIWAGTPPPSHIKTKNRGEYFIYAVSGCVSFRHAWQIIEK